jgi:hypothetical protein
MTDNTDLARVEKKVDDLTLEIRSLVDAWNTARGVVKFVKVIGSVATAITAVWALLKIGHTIK